jgi:hypothetical protein
MKDTVGEQLSLFNLPRTKSMRGGMPLLAELREICERPKGLGQSKYRREVKDD